MLAAAQKGVSNVLVMLDAAANLFFGSVVLVVQDLLKLVKDHHNGLAGSVRKLLRRVQHLDQISL